MKNSGNKQISISIVISVITMIATFFVSFFFVSFLLSKPQIGDANYGLKTTADSFTSFITVFSFGMTTTFITFLRKNGKQNEKKTFTVFTFISLCIALIGIIFGIIIVGLTKNGLILSPEKYSQSQIQSFIYVFIISLFSGISSIILYNSKYYLEATKRIVTVRIINLFITIAYPVISIPIVLAGGDIIAISIVYASTHFIGNLFYLIFSIRNSGGRLISFKSFDKLLFKEIIIYSFFVVIASAVETFSSSLDKVILTVTLSSTLATVYQLGMTLNQVLLSLVDLFFAPYLPFLSELNVETDGEVIRKTYFKILKILLIITFTVFIGFVVIGKDFVLLWVGDSKTDVYYYSLLVFSVWPLYSIAKFSTSLHRIYEKHKINTIHYLVSFALHITISVSFIWLIGIWSCFIGLVVSMIYLGIAFICVNSKHLFIPVKNTIILLLKYSAFAIVSIGFAHVFQLIFFKDASLPTLISMILRGIIVVTIWAIIVYLSDNYYFKTSFKKILIKMCSHSRKELLFTVAHISLITTVITLSLYLPYFYIDGRTTAFVISLVVNVIIVVLNNYLIIKCAKHGYFYYSLLFVLSIVFLSLVLSALVILVVSLFSPIKLSTIYFVITPSLSIAFSFAILIARKKIIKNGF